VLLGRLASDDDVRARFEAAPALVFAEFGLPVADVPAALELPSKAALERVVSGLPNPLAPTARMWCDRM